MPSFWVQLHQTYRKLQPQGYSDGSNPMKSQMLGQKVLAKHWRHGSISLPSTSVCPSSVLFVFKVFICKQYFRHTLFIRKVKTESFGGLELINSIYVLSNGKNDWVFEQITSCKPSGTNWVQSLRTGSTLFCWVLGANRSIKCNP